MLSKSRKRPLTIDMGANLAAGDTSVGKRPNSSLVPHSNSSNSRVVYMAKPLVGRSYILDLEDRKEYTQLAAEITKMGGNIVDSINSQNGKDRVTLISDHRSAERLERATASIDKPAEKLAPATLKALPILLRQAHNSNIKVRTLNNFKIYLKMVKTRLATSISVTNAPQKVNPRKSLLLNLNDSIGSQKKEKKLRPPFLKMEDACQSYCPIYKQFSSKDNYRTLYVGLEYGNSLFHKASREQMERRQREEMAAKEIAEEGMIIPNNNQRRLTTTKQKAGGYCEICGTKYEEDLRLHYKSRDHMTRVLQPGFYDEVDGMLGSYVQEINCPHFAPISWKAGPPGLKNQVRKSHFTRYKILRLFWSF
ncbi:hypothetical protein WR25_21309 isoform C [Diploscapter pachys]|uniref:DBF4-type domain-containing protein n=2 Tax=Diploscapter pachys TaxID=2018661 RepID=A0A2A2KMI5_9BILA|nr:hypothetical protein WR25_21309 isoform C [Diploscapter pachys]